MNICKIYSLLANDFRNIEKLPLKLGVKMITYAIEKEHENKAWDMWLSKYQHMDKENFVPFSKFLDDMKPKKVIKKSADDILKEADKIMRSLNK